MRRGWVVLVLVLLACAPAPAPPLPQAPCPACQLDCRTCPPQVQEKQIPVKVYVCPDGAEVENASLCLPPKDLALRQSFRHLYLKDFTIKPACFKGEPAGEVYWKTGTFATTVEVQARQDDGSYKVIYSDQGKYEGRRTFNFRPTFKIADFALAPGETHILRLQLVYGEDEDTLGAEVTDEVLVDAREGAAYLSKVCSS